MPSPTYPCTLGVRCELSDCVSASSSLSLACLVEQTLYPQSMKSPEEECGQHCDVIFWHFGVNSATPALVTCNVQDVNQSYIYWDSHQMCICLQIGTGVCFPRLMQQGLTKSITILLQFDSTYSGGLQRHPASGTTAQFSAATLACEDGLHAVNDFSKGCS